MSDHSQCREKVFGGNVLSHVCGLCSHGLNKSNWCNLTGDPDEDERRRQMTIAELDADICTSPLHQELLAKRDQRELKAG